MLKRYKKRFHKACEKRYFYIKEVAIHLFLVPFCIGSLTTTTCSSTGLSSHATSNCPSLLADNVEKEIISIVLPILRNFVTLSRVSRNTLHFICSILLTNCDLEKRFKSELPNRYWDCALA